MRISGERKGAIVMNNMTVKVKGVVREIVDLTGETKGRVK